MSEVITFGGWLKQRRRESGVTQEELAESIGCSGTAIRKIEVDLRHPSGQIAHLLADYLLIPADEREAFIAFARSGRAASIPAGTATGDTAMRAPWRNMYLHQTNLPAVLTPLIGRGQEVSTALNHLLQSKVRLLTLTGGPGIGKTRLAMQVASDLVDRFEDGVYLVELAAVEDPNLVLQQVARSLDLKEAADRTLERVLFDHVHDRKMLLLLDNFEQVLDAASFIVKLLEASPWLKVLVTSREALHVRGERRLSVPPLGLPDLSLLSKFTSDPARTVDLQTSYPSVQLFVERATAVNPSFELTRENYTDIAVLCIGLEGLPLAIELAAARAYHLSPTEMRAALDNRLKLLTGGGRDLAARHRTLRSAIEWSYALLNDAEQALFCGLGVFVGGCTLSAIEAVSVYSLAGNSEQSSVPISRVLEALVDKNLVRKHIPADKSGAIRFTMLEAIREYALSQLEQNGDLAHARQRHAEYYLGLVEEAETHLRDADQVAWLDRLEDDHENLRAVLLWAAQRGAREGPRTSASSLEPGTLGALEIGLRMVGALWLFWYIRGNLSEGRLHLETALAISGVASTAGHLLNYRANALLGMATLMQEQGEYAHVGPLYEESLFIWRDIGDMTGVATALNKIAGMLFDQGEYVQARSIYEETLAVRRAIGDKAGIASALNNLGTLAYELRDFENARSLNEESLSIRREIGDRGGIAMSLNNLASLASEQKDYESARGLHMEGLAIKREMGNKSGIARSLGNLGHLALEQGEYAEAGSLFRESLAIRRELGDKVGIMWCLIALGWVMSETGEPQQAAKLLGTASVMLETLPGTLHVEDREMYRRGVAAARIHLEDREFEVAWSEGCAMSIGETIEYALAKNRMD